MTQQVPGSERRYEEVEDVQREGGYQRCLRRRWSDHRVERRVVARRPRLDAIPSWGRSPADIEVERRAQRDPHRESVDQFRELATASAIYRITNRESQS